jgi:hypothetical protein
MRKGREVMVSRGRSAIAVLAAILLLGASSDAATILPNSMAVTGIGQGDVGLEFTVAFDGRVDIDGVGNGLLIPDLTSQVDFSVVSFVRSGDQTTLVLGGILTNTSGGAITSSKVSTVGFDTNLSAVRSGSSVVDGFSTIAFREGPTHMSIDVCSKNGNANSCGGGGNGGALQGSSVAFTATLLFEAVGGVQSVDLSNFNASYKLIQSEPLMVGGQEVALNDYSGVGEGFDPYYDPLEETPEPNTALLAMIALLFLRRGVRRGVTRA